ncbi:hypothetical protein BRDCF_p1873 [Bacteroidales bacterium CF]|jgi:hypothetical protein|nr:hypothetical protein BRDCF_p1873 [Bacteroidales bacterium CF]
MKITRIEKSMTLILLLISITSLRAQLTAPGVKWEEVYSFDKFNSFKIDFYAKNNELMRTLDIKTYYQADGKDFAVFTDSKSKGGDILTVFDLKNEVAIQIFGNDLPEPMYNAGRFKYPAKEELKKLELTPTDETKTIAGFECIKYNYTYKKIFGSVWITQQIKQPNDYGIFRAAKMSALHNTLSVEGFVMEMTTEDSKGGKTIMTTVSIEQDANYSVNLKRVNMGTALNKVSYFAF